MTPESFLFVGNIKGDFVYGWNCRKYKCLTPEENVGDIKPDWVRIRIVGDMKPDL